MRPTTTGRWRWTVPIGAGAVHAGLVALAFPPVGAWAVAFLAPIPLIWIAVRVRRSEPAKGRLGWASRWRWPLLAGLGVAPLWVFEVQWVVPVTGFGYLPFVMALAAFASLFVWALARIPGWLPWSVAAPVLWVGVEFLRGEIVLTGFPWLLVAHPLIDAPLLAAPAAVGGVYLVGLLAVIPAGALADVVVWRRRWAPAFAAMAAILVWAGSWPLSRTSAIDRASVRIAVVQTNVPQSNKSFWTLGQQIDDWNRFEELTLAAAQGDPRPDLIVWPETMFPGPFLDTESTEVMRRSGAYWQESLRPGEPPVDVPFVAFVDRLLAVQEHVSIPMVVGALAVQGLRIEDGPRGIEVDWTARFNSTFLVASGAVSPVRYDKLALTPFGEVMPYLAAWPWLEDQVIALIGPPGMKFDLEAGSGPRFLSVDLGGKGTLQVGTPICFEVTKSGVCRRIVRTMSPDSPRVLANLTNDGWFGWFDPAREQHLQIARWRCLELGVPMIRAANTGISAVIDARARVTAAGVPGGRARADGVLAADVDLSEIETIYRRVGDVAGGTAFAGAVVLVLLPVIRRRGASGQEPS